MKEDFVVTRAIECAADPSTFVRQELLDARPVAEMFITRIVAALFNDQWSQARHYLDMWVEGKAHEDYRHERG